MRALDLFCGGGGTALGLVSAGFDVVGIDINPRHAKVYPGEFICGDALNPPVRLGDFDFIWASPPCQKFSIGTPVVNKATLPDLIQPTRALLSGHPFTVMENVPNAPIRPDLVLTGPMVNLCGILRRRHFELSWFTLQPPILGQVGDVVSVTKHLSAPSHFYRRKAQGLPGRVSVAEARQVMGITTPMTCDQIGEAVPPAYAEYIGRIVMDRLKSGRPLSPAANAEEA